MYMHAYPGQEIFCRHVLFIESNSQRLDKIVENKYRKKHNKCTEKNNIII